MDNKPVLVILSIIVAPLAVFLNKGQAGTWMINIILCLLFYLPGVLHALRVVTR